MDGNELVELLARISEWRKLSEESAKSGVLAAHDAQRLQGLRRLFANPIFASSGRPKARRRFDRVAAEGRARLVAGDNALAASLTDVSAGGACVSVPDEPPAVGTELRLEVVAGDEAGMAFKAKVVWTGREGRGRIGLAFTDAGMPIAKAA